MATDVLNRKGSLRNSLKRELDQTCSFFLLENGTELLEGFSRNCHPTLTYVNSKSLIIGFRGPGE